MIDMVSFEQLDSRHFKAFLFALEAQNFTLGAQKAGMTQSGLSQHIAKLEDQLGVLLFERVNKKVILTPAGRKLKDFIERYNEIISAFLEDLTDTNNSPQGLVRYGMPASCLKTPHFSILLKNRNKHFSKLNLKVELLDNGQILDKLLNAEIDFGFVTFKDNNPAINYEKFCNEEYVLVHSSKEFIKKIDETTMSEIPFITYPGFGDLFQIWRKHFFPKKLNLSEKVLNVVGNINDLDGSITMVNHGMGAGIYPSHCVAEELNKGKIHKFSYKNFADPVGEIFIVTRANFERPKRLQKVIDTFWSMI